jgi:hypothetical protein
VIGADPHPAANASLAIGGHSGHVVIRDKASRR